MLGWGLIHSSQTNNNLDVFDWAQLPILDQARVNSQEWTDGIILDSHLSAGFPSGSVDSCPGDSGGPLLIWNKNHWEIIGINTVGSQYCESSYKFPPMFSRLSHKESRDWIINIINTNSNNAQDYTGVGTFKGMLFSDENAKTAFKAFQVQLCDMAMWENNPPKYYCQKSHQ